MMGCASLGRILASVYDGGLQEIQAIVENQTVSPWIRSGAPACLMVLWKESVVECEQIVSYLQTLLGGKSETVPSYAWDTIALMALGLHRKKLESLDTLTFYRSELKPLITY